MLSKSFLLFAVGLILFVENLYAAALVDPRLKNFASQRTNQKVQVIALMKNETAGLAAPQRYNYRAVHQFLVTRARFSWEQVKNVVAKSPADITVRAAFWINNSFMAEVTPQGLKTLAQIPNIEKIYLNGKIEYARPATRSGSFRMQRNAAYPYDLVDIGIDKLMEKRPDLI